ncbi:hypothetical protein [Ruminococcus bromii]|jgi:hypothetical protein|uniref:hypothetical protein n=1 Tax=Ruminococcus bromii TaxID=40518 RepID=UPI003A90909E
MKQMIYTPNRNNKGEILAAGDYKNFKYYVVSVGTHPCAYVDVSNTSLANKDYCENDIDCHGGLTYGRDYLSALDTEKTNGKWYIGWDYAHYGDYMPNSYISMSGVHINMFGVYEEWEKRWTTEEIVAECKNVINQIVDKEGM